MHSCQLIQLFINFGNNHYAYTSCTHIFQSRHRLFTALALTGSLSHQVLSKRLYLSSLGQRYIGVVLPCLVLSCTKKSKWSQNLWWSWHIELLSTQIVEECYPHCFSEKVMVSFLPTGHTAFRKKWLMHSFSYCSQWTFSKLFLVSVFFLLVCFLPRCPGGTAQFDNGCSWIVQTIMSILTTFHKRRIHRDLHLCI